jgi:hypothetical protein
LARAGQFNRRTLTYAGSISGEHIKRNKRIRIALNRPQAVSLAQALGQFPSGRPGTCTYYVMACANYNNAVTESNTANNCTAVQITVAGTDLVESAVSILTTTPALGGSVQVSDTMLNQGLGIAGSSLTGFYLSANGTTKGTYLGYRSIGTVNPAGTSGPLTTTLRLPTNMAAGTYYVIACANYSGSYRLVTSKCLRVRMMFRI